MRVAQLIDRVHTSGGAERLQRTFAETLDPLRVELSVVTLRPDQPEVVAWLRDHGVRVVSFPARRFGDLARARALLRFLRRERFDLIHTHLVRSTVLGGVLGRLTGTPVVTTLHNTEHNHKVGRVLRLGERWVLRNAVDHVIAVGWETARAHGDSLGSRSIEVIPNAVTGIPELSPAERESVRVELGVPVGAPLVLAVGRLVAQKAFSDLLCAFAALPASGRTPQLRIAGRGHLERALAHEIAERGLADRVALLGVRSDVARLMGAADVYVSSSHWEGMPVAMLEAMSSGLPVVATDVGDVARVLGEECGVLVPARDPAALARALDELLGDPARRERLGAAGRIRARSHFGAEAWGERHMALYASLRRPTQPTLRAREEPHCAS
jgi:glycosyltransferase involved in cell wall biosynthesis